MIATKANLWHLGKGNPQTIHVQQAHWRHPMAPRAGRVYKLTVEGGGGMDATAMAVVAHEVDGWLVTVQRGDHRDVPRLLRARPGAGGDYTDQSRLAALGEPEAVPEADQRRYAKTASDRDDLVRRAKVAEARRLIDQGVEILRGQGARAKRAADSITHYADGIDRDAA